jgi:hypothetical protein
MHFKRSSKIASTIQESFYPEVPGSFDFLTDQPLIYEKLHGKIRGFAMSPLGAAGGGYCRIPARLAAGVEGKGYVDDWRLTSGRFGCSDGAGRPAVILRDGAGRPLRLGLRRGARQCRPTRACWSTSAK